MLFIENICYQAEDFLFFFADLNLVTIYFVFLLIFFYFFCCFFVLCRKLVNSIILAINGREQR